MNKTVKNLTLSAMFMAIGVVLPILTGQIQQIGNMLLPMHLPVFLCGLICGWQYGAAVGFVLPLFRSVTFGMPPLFPTATATAFELATYGLVAGLLYGRSRWQCVIKVCFVVTPAGIGLSSDMEKALEIFTGNTEAYGIGNYRVSYSI